MSLKTKLNIRKTIWSSLERTHKFLEKFDAAKQANQVPSRLETLNQTWAEFEALQLDIETIEVEEAGKDVDVTKLAELHSQTRDTFEELYHQVRAGLKAKLPSGVLSGNVARAGIQLPKISLPKFSGEYDEWLPFHDTFKSLIHDNPDLSAIQKFHYLRASLSGEALKMVDPCEFSEKSYGVAWDMLVKRHSNTYLQKKRHVNALLQYPRAKKLTATGIHEVVDCFNRHTKILDQLGEKTEGWGAMLTQLLVSKLDDAMQRDWEASVSRKDDPQFKDVMDFLEVQTKIMDAVAVDRYAEGQQAASTVPVEQNMRSFPNVNVAVESSQMMCPVCNGSHLVARCPVFQELPLEERLEQMWSRSLCRNCLRTGHLGRHCYIPVRCGICGVKHHTLLHPGSLEAELQGTLEGKGPEEPHAGGSGCLPVATTSSESDQALLSSVATTQAANVASDPGKVHVFLSTVLVSVKDSNGRLHTARALLDSGSQANLISERLCQLLRLPRKRVSVPVAGIGNSRMQIDRSVSAVIASRITDYSVPMEFLVMKKVAEDQPSATIPIGEWKLPEDMMLADPGFYKRASIDLLLGLEYFYEFLLLNGGRLQIQRPGVGLPLFVNTVFGWIAAGKSGLGSLNPVPSCHVSIHASSCIQRAVRSEIQRTPQVDLTRKMETFLRRRDLGQMQPECGAVRSMNVMCGDLVPKGVGAKADFKQKKVPQVAEVGCDSAFSSDCEGRRTECNQKGAVVKSAGNWRSQRRKQVELGVKDRCNCKQEMIGGLKHMYPTAGVADQVSSKPLQGSPEQRSVGGRRIFAVKQFSANPCLSWRSEVSARRISPMSIPQNSLTQSWQQYELCGNRLATNSTHYNPVPDSWYSYSRITPNRALIHSPSSNGQSVKVWSA